MKNVLSSLNLHQGKHSKYEKEPFWLEMCVTITILRVKLNFPSTIFDSVWNVIIKRIDSIQWKSLNSEGREVTGKTLEVENSEGDKKRTSVSSRCAVSK